jgi:hypothetical protein
VGREGKQFSKSNNVGHLRVLLLRHHVCLVVSQIFRKHLQSPILGNIVSRMTGLGAVQPTNRGSITGKGKRYFRYSKASSPALVPTHPSTQCVSRALPQRVKRSKYEVKTLTYISVGRNTPPMPSKRAGKQPYFTTFLITAKHEASQPLDSV